MDELTPERQPLGLESDEAGRADVDLPHVQPVAAHKFLYELQGEAFAPGHSASYISRWQQVLVRVIFEIEEGLPNPEFSPARQQEIRQILHRHASGRSTGTAAVAAMIIGLVSQPQEPAPVPEASSESVLDRPLGEVVGEPFSLRDLIEDTITLRGPNGQEFELGYEVMGDLGAEIPMSEAAVDQLAEYLGFCTRDELQEALDKLAEELGYDYLRFAEE